MITIGIDPGLSGAIACVSDEGVIALHDMPVMPYGRGAYVKNAVDLTAVARLLSARGPAVVWLERVGSMPGQGVASMFSLGMSYYGVAGVAIGLGIPVNLVMPADWKGDMGLGRDKGESLALARKLHPNLDLSRKKDHGRAEALLIARYGQKRRMH